jgi:hypothetical protein
MGFGANPVRCYDEVVEAISTWDIGATGAHTKTSNIPGTQFASVARTAAGKYTVTFSAGVPRGDLLALECFHQPAANAGPLNLRMTKASYTRESAALGQATVLYEAWSVGTTPAQTELSNGDKVTLKAIWSKTR